MIVTLNGVDYYHRKNIFLNKEYFSFVFDRKDDIKLVTYTEELPQYYSDGLKKIETELVQESEEISTTALRVKIRENGDIHDGIILENCDVIIDIFNVIGIDNSIDNVVLNKVNSVYFTNFQTRVSPAETVRGIEYIICNANPKYVANVGLYNAFKTMVKKNKHLVAK